MNICFFEESDLFNRCVDSQEPLLRSLAFRLRDAWDALVNVNEAESLMNDVNELIKKFEGSDEYPTIDEISSEVLAAHGDFIRAALKWASACAGLAERIVGKADISDVCKLIAGSALIMFQCYQPRTAEAFNNYVSRKGGAARNAQSKELRGKLLELIEDEISLGNKRFNSKVEAAEYFAPLLNEAASNLGIKNVKPAMGKTIRNWFSTDDTLSALIRNLISAAPTRRRSH